MAKLTKNEHLEITLNAEQIDSARLQYELEVERKKSTLLQAKIMELENRNKITSLNEKIKGLSNKLERAKIESAEYTNKLKTKYKIKDSFGINPDTGEILEE